MQVTDKQTAGPLLIILMSGVRKRVFLSLYQLDISNGSFVLPLICIGGGVKRESCGEGRDTSR